MDHPIEGDASGRVAGASTAIGRELERIRGNRSIVDMAKLLDIHANTLSNYEMGKRKPDIDFLFLFSARTGASLTDLIAARLDAAGSQADELEGQLVAALTKGSIRRDDVTRVLRPHNPELASDVALMFPERSDLLDVKLYNVRVSAGQGIALEDERVIGTRSFNKSWIMDRLRMRAEDLALVVAHGDSMSPTIGDGDLLMINIAQNKLVRDDIYVLREDDNLIVKRLQRLPGGRFRLISDNPQYQPIEYNSLVLSDGTFNIVGRCVWWAHTNT